MKKYKNCHQSFDEKIEELRSQGHIVPDHSLIKTPEQIAGIKESAKINIAVLDEVASKIKEGMTTEEIDKIVYDTTTKMGGIPAPLNYEGFPKSVCTSINEEVCHGIPSPKVVLKDGDIINVDVSTIYKGYYSDSSRMFCIGNVSDEKRKLVQVVKECVELGLEQVKIAQERKAAEEARLQAEARRQEEARLAEEKRLAEAKRAEEARIAEEKRQAEIQRVAAEKKAAEERRERERIRQAIRQQELARLNAKIDPDSQRSGTPSGDKRNQRQNLTGSALASYNARIIACVRPNISIDVPSSTRRGQFIAEFVVRPMPNGELAGAPVYAKKSGWDAYDSAVRNAILKCKPFPVPEKGYNIPKEVRLRFDPVDDRH